MLVMYWPLLVHVFGETQHPGGLRGLKGAVKGSSPSSLVGGLAGPLSHCSAS